MGMPNSKLRNEQVTVEISKNKMYGIISYKEPGKGGKLLTLEEVREQIQKKGIVFGIDEKAIQDSFDNKRYGFKYIIAKGIAPISGEAATLTFHFDRIQMGKREPKKNEDGTVDFKELGLVINTRQGDVLVSKKPATEGIAGKNVFGQMVAATRGKDVVMPKGKNTQVSEDGLSLVACIDGQINYNHDVVTVSPNYIVNTDVDSGVGNIDFIGNVIVNGGVKSGYTIRAGGNIEIRGPVEAATIIAEGDIVLWYGIQGGDKGELNAQGNIITKFIQNATIHAGSDVISEMIMHSEVSAGGNVMVDQNKGLIVGGSIAAGKGVYVNTLGSCMATVTTIELGRRPHAIARYKQLQQTYFELKERCCKTDQNVSFLKLKGLRGLSKDKKVMLEKVLQVQKQLQQELAKVEREYFALRDTIQKIDTGIIKVSNIIYPGVRVTIGDTVKCFIEEAQYCTITKVEGDINIGPY